MNLKKYNQDKTTPIEIDKDVKISNKNNNNKQTNKQKTKKQKKKKYKN
ncbi:hypothetical protein HYE42_00930 [Mycoplasmopsis bovis]|nr:hypothetical protein HYE42_00930 [Mycoplasmopsis bovis]